MPRILVAEGEPLIASFVQRGLRLNGFATRVAHEPDDIVELAASGEYDLLIAEERLIAAGDAEPLEYLRACGLQLPVLLLRSQPEHVADTAPATGSSQTLVKPFRFGELLAGVRSLLELEGIAEPTILRAGDASLDLSTGRLTVGDESHDLSPIELVLADTLFRQAGRDLSLAELIRYSATNLDSHAAGVVEAEFRRLRSKLGGELMATVGLIGYRLRADDVP
jgi:two-component system, OmpR family, copper resistance phosphate regulon response regulator CusR